MDDELDEDSPVFRFDETKPPIFEPTHWDVIPMDEWLPCVEHTLTHCVFMVYPPNEAFNPDGTFRTLGLVARYLGTFNRGPSPEGEALAELGSAAILAFLDGLGLLTYRD